MSRIVDVIKNKNKIEKNMQKRRQRQIIAMKTSSAFKSKMYEELRHIDEILSDSNVEAVIITVSDKALANFSAAIYSEDMAGYNVEQLEGETNKFYIRQKYIAF